jgi:large subunit ribosomal protein L25
VGVAKGGKLIQKLRKVKISALPANLPDFVTIDVSELDLGKTVKVSSIPTDNYTILNPPSVPVVTIEIPRALKNQKG